MLFHQIYWPNALKNHASHHKVHFLTIWPFEQITSRHLECAKWKCQTQISNLPHAPMIWMLIYDWFHSVSLFVLFSPRKVTRFYPEILNESCISEKKKTNHFRFQITPVSLPTVLLSSQVSCCTPACLPLSADFHGKQHRGSAVSVRNYAPWTVWLNSAGWTDGRMSMKVGQ